MVRWVFVVLGVGVGLYALGLSVSNWRGVTPAARKRALRTSRGASTPGTAGFVILPCAALWLIIAMGVLASIPVSSGAPGALFSWCIVLFLIVNFTMLGAFVICGLLGGPIVYPRWASEDVRKH